MKLAAFDLDNTLLAGDSDYLWGQFLVANDVVDASNFEAENRRFYEQYEAGTLDIHEYARFALGLMGRIDPKKLSELRQRFVNDIIEPIVAPGAKQLIAEHRRDGAELLIITATNTFVTEPIAALLDVPVLIGTEPMYSNGRMTGEISGTPCFQAGKVKKLLDWLGGREVTESWFYSDSVNDAPLLEWADHPFAVDPCPRLQRLADDRGWPVISLRGE